MAPWQARWVALHDDLHLLEVLLEAIQPPAETTIVYWQLAEEVISLPMHAYLDVTTQDRVIEAVRVALRP